MDTPHKPCLPRLRGGRCSFKCRRDSDSSVTVIYVYMLVASFFKREKKCQLILKGNISHYANKLSTQQTEAINRANFTVTVVNHKVVSVCFYEVNNDLIKLQNMSFF